jgi:hypothetical protein
LTRGGKIIRTQDHLVPENFLSSRKILPKGRKNILNLKILFNRKNFCKCIHHLIVQYCINACVHYIILQQMLYHGKWVFSQSGTPNQFQNFLRRIDLSASGIVLTIVVPFFGISIFTLGSDPLCMSSTSVLC